MKKLEKEEKTLDNSNSALSKKIRKVVEEVILQYEEEFTTKFTEEEMIDVLKHKSQIGKLSVEDSQLEQIIKDEVEDCIDAYLIKKRIKKK